MGAVYLAEDEGLGRRVAIKVVLGRDEGDEASRQRFRREARAMASVDHPNVVRVHAFGSVGTTDYLVMEHVEGETLAARLRRVGALDEADACRLLREIVQGLQAAWEQGIVHRDVKPSNILLDAKGRARVADFGLARSAAHVAGDGSITDAHQVVGTLHYLSPEQAQGRPADCRSDIYSLGLVLYEMLIGQRPYESTTPLDALAQRLHGPAPDLKRKRPNVSAQLATLFEWMTQKDPEKRPTSYQALLQVLEPLGGLSPATLFTPLVPAPTRRRRSRKTLVALSGGAIVLLLAAWFGWRMLGSTAPAPPAADAGKRLVVAVAPFYGPDEDSLKEGRVTAGLVEKAIGERLGKYDVKVLGLDETGPPVRNHDAARALGERLKATVVVWGEAFTLRGETEIQPYITMVRRQQPAATTADAEPMTARAALAAQDPFATLQQASAGPVVLQATAPNQIALRKTSAAGIGDMVLLMAGVHALYTENNAAKALTFFDQAPRNAESLRHRAEALLQLKKTDEALAALRESVTLDPRDAQSRALLGDLHMEAERWQDAADAYRGAAETGQAFTTRKGVFYQGNLCGKERPIREVNEFREGAYFLCRDPGTGRVLERYCLPGVAQEFTPLKDGGIQIAYGLTQWEGQGTIVFAQGRFDRPVFYTASLLARRVGMSIGVALARNFLSVVSKAAYAGAPLTKFPRKARNESPDTPTDIGELELAARRANQLDPTQPWHLFVLGQALWAQDRQADAEEAWRDIFTGIFPATPYYEFSRMADWFEQLGQRAWADRAFEEALRRRRQVPQAIETTTLIARLINEPFIGTAASNVTDPERRYLWFQRVRQLSGICLEGDDYAAAAWAEYFAQRGDLKRGAQEQEFSERVRSHPGNRLSQATMVDYSLYALGSTMVALVVLLAFLVVRMATLRPALHGLAALLSPVARVSAPERRTLGIGLLAVALALCFALASVHRMGATAGIPWTLTDAEGSRSFLVYLDGALKKNDTRELRFVAATANHLAGNRGRASELYRSVLPDARAQQDLDALEKGAAYPPAPATAAETYRAVCSMPWTQWFDLVVLRPGTSLPFFDLIGDLSTSFIRLLLVIGGALLLAFCFVPPVAGIDGPIPRTRLGKLLTRIGFTLVPGAYDLRRGSPARGYAVLTLFVFALLVIVFRIRNATQWTMGVYSAVVWPGFGRAFPLPWPAGTTSGAAAIKAHYWTWFWAQPYAGVFCAVVALAGVISLGLHVARLRTIWSAQAGGPKEA